MEVLLPYAALGKPLGWVIAGGQSGGRPADWLVGRCGGSPCPLHGADFSCGPGQAWAPKPEARQIVRAIRDQCREAGVAFFFKQWGGPKSTSGGRLLDGREWTEFPTTATAVAHA